MRKFLKLLFWALLSLSIVFAYKNRAVQNKAVLSLSAPTATITGIVSNTATPAVTITYRQLPTSTPVPAKKIEEQILKHIPSNTPILLPITAAEPTQAAKLVNVEITAGGNTSSFSLEFTNSINVCDVLEKARNEGKITSLTIDDSYMKTFNSKYVKELNGYKDNWTFTVNGNSPLGCSLYNVNDGDSIVWKSL